MSKLEETSRLIGCYLTIKRDRKLTASQGPSLPRLFLRQLFRYVRILFLALSANSGNCLVQLSMIACIFSFGCFEIGTMRSRFSSTNSLTNICRETRRNGHVSGV